MKQHSFLFWFICLSVTIAAIHFFSINKFWVEKYYSTGIYPAVSLVFKYLFGWIAFSVGDILYGLLILYSFSRLFKLMRTLFRKKKQKRFLLIALFKKGFIVLAFVYIIFNLLWGINYNRIGIANQLGIKMEKYSTNDLVIIDSMLLEKVNKSKLALLENNTTVYTQQQIFNQSNIAYDSLGRKYAFLKNDPFSIKPSLWGWLGNYVGFLGYYNPFTGEAQVNTTVPNFLQPFITCHELAHQIGYAKENEANFVGYMAATSSTDSFFKYSVYLDLFLYTNRNLYVRDSSASRRFSLLLLPAVKKDLKSWQEFDSKHRNPVEPVIRWLYGKFLQQNQQPSGIMSYDEVTGFLIAYYKKFGVI